MEHLGPANWGQAAWLALGAYALGCVATGYYLVRWRTGLDLRQLGSGTLGARNTGRILGPAGFLTAAGGDVAKGALAVWLVRHFTRQDPLDALALLAVVAGHIWPVQLRFRGGKGIATSIGALAVYNLPLALAYGVLFGITVAMSRRGVIAGLLPFACLPVLSLCWWTGAAEDAWRTSALAALAAMVVIAHRSNLRVEALRLLARRKLNPNPDPPAS